MSNHIATCIAALLVTGACDLSYSPEVGLLPADEVLPDAGGDGDGGNSDASLDPDASTLATPGRCDDGDPSIAVTFSGHMRPLFARSPGACTGCHGTSATSGFGVGSYDSIRRGGVVSGTRIIIPGKPCESILYQKLGPAPPFGSRMPNGGPPYYSATDLALVRDWIAEGALNN